MSEIDRLGVERVMREALEFLAGAAFLHVSLDLDAVDPMFAPGVGTPVRGGLSYREAHLALELVAESERLDSLERRRGEPDPRPRERDRDARRRAGRERSRRADPLRRAWPRDGAARALRDALCPHESHGRSSRRAAPRDAAGPALVGPRTTTALRAYLRRSILRARTAIDVDRARARGRGRRLSRRSAA